MAPVFEQISPIYKNPKFFVTLAQPMRNRNQPALMSLCSQLRNTVERLDFRPILEVPGVIDYLTPQQAGDFVSSVFKDENPGCRILCYTNDRVQLYNQHRGFPFPRLYRPTVCGVAGGPLGPNPLPHIPPISQ